MPMKVKYAILFFIPFSMLLVTNGQLSYFEQNPHCYVPLHKKLCFCIFILFGYRERWNSSFAQELHEKLNVLFCHILFRSKNIKWLHRTWCTETKRLEEHLLFDWRDPRRVPSSWKLTKPITKSPRMESVHWNQFDLFLVDCKGLVLQQDFIGDFLARTLSMKNIISSCGAGLYPYSTHWHHQEKEKRGKKHAPSVKTNSIARNDRRMSEVCQSKENEKKSDPSAILFRGKTNQHSLWHRRKKGRKRKKARKNAHHHRVISAQWSETETSLKSALKIRVACLIIVRIVVIIYTFGEKFGSTNTTALFLLKRILAMEFLQIWFHRKLNHWWSLNKISMG